MGEGLSALGGAMRFVWTDAGDEPRWGVGDKHGIDGYFMPMFDSLTTQEFLRDEVKARGHVAGIYLGHGWPQEQLPPAQCAAAVSAEYKRCFVPGLRVMFNMEEQQPEKIVATMEAWRVRHPTVPTSWSSEGMQGGWMSSLFVQRMVACRVRVVPQCFTGNMTRRESDIVKADVVRRGFPENIVSCFYDAAQLGQGWDGYAFTMGRLPQ